MDRIGPASPGDLIEPQRRGPHAIAPAPAPLHWPAAARPLEVSIAGAGRLFDLAVSS